MCVGSGKYARLLYIIITITGDVYLKKVKNTHITVWAPLFSRGSLLQNPVDHECLGLSVHAQITFGLERAPISWHYSTMFGTFRYAFNPIMMCTFLCVRVHVQKSTIYQYVPARMA